MHLYGDTAADYRAFAREAGDSPTYVDWASSVAEDPEVVDWLDALPPLKRQPNLLFAAARHHGVRAPGEYADLRAAVLGDDGTLRATVLARGTQTNEALRMASLVPVLGLVQQADPRPIALVEVGASAGLCLYPDRWDHVWWPVGELRGDGVDAADRPVLSTAATGPVPVPAGAVRVASRTGVDLHPLDVEDPDTLEWLETLVWPEHEERRDRLRQAVEVARSDPPRLVSGDLLDQLPVVLDELVAGEVQVVVQHSAVVAYLPPADRERFEALVRREVAAGRCRWVSNEPSPVLPGVRLPRGAPDPEGRFVLALDGVPLALTHGHGRTLDWLG